jgi:hypothetical protein
VIKAKETRTLIQLPWTRKGLLSLFLFTESPGRSQDIFLDIWFLLILTPLRQTQQFMLNDRFEQATCSMRRYLAPDDTIVIYNQAHAGIPEAAE